MTEEEFYWIDDPITDAQRQHIESLMEWARQTDEQCRYWRNKMGGATYEEAQQIIEELKAINKLLNHPRFAGGAISHKEGVKQGREIIKGS